jgi:PAS domain S-box-containing protein
MKSDNMELTTRLKYERAISACSQILLEDTEDTINKILRKLQSTTRCSRVYIFMNSVSPEGTLLMSQTHEICVPGVRSELDNPELQKLPYRNGLQRWERLLMDGEAIHGLVRKFPPEEQDILSSLEIKTILIIPVITQQRWWGFIGFDDVYEERHWPPEDMELLKTAAGMLGRYFQNKQLSQQLKESEEKYRQVVVTALDAIILIDTGGNIVEWNRGAEEILEIPAEKAKRSNAFEIMTSNISDQEKKQKVNSEIKKVIEHIKISEELPDTMKQLREQEIVLPSGNKKVIQSLSFPIRYSKTVMIGTIIRDATVQAEMARKLQESAREKEILLREIHHRVKNNLAMVESFVRLQELSCRDQESADQFAALSRQIHSITEVHNLLYKSTDLTKINLGTYINEIVNNIFNVTPEMDRRIDRNIDVDHIVLDMDTLLPLGLIVTELFWNSLKHAFPDGRKGNISLDIKGDKTNFTLHFQDDGTGFRAIDRGSGSLGLTLVSELVNQIGGTLEVKHEGGAGYLIQVKK